MSAGPARGKLIAPLQEGRNLTNRERVLRYVQRHPGEDDDQISDATGIRPRQQVNILLRMLAASGEVERVKRLGDKIRNYPVR